MIGEANKLVSDYKFKLKKSEQEVTVLQGSVARLETQLTRYRIAAEEAEKLEDELKADKRKSQRDVSHSCSLVYVLIYYELNSKTKLTIFLTISKLNPN